MYCKNCGVELENDMLICPLCMQPVNDTQTTGKTGPVAPVTLTPLDKKQRKLSWMIISLALGTAMITACIVNFIISGKISWAEYPTAVGLAIFWYVSILAWWNKRIMIEMLCGFLLSSLSFLILDAITGGIVWALRLGIPLLFCANLVAVIYIEIVHSSRDKGISLIAYAFFCAALLCICTEGILSFFMHDVWRLSWSLIVLACVIPVAVVLLFVYFRLKKGQSLKRTFHV